jgi:hypothetical protein
VPVPLYMDVHVPRAITLGLRMRKVDVVTAQEDRAEDCSDAEILARATGLGRAVFTFDADFLVEGAKSQREAKNFAGILYAHPLRVSIGQCVHDLEVIAMAGEPKDLENTIEFLPLTRPAP